MSRLVPARSAATKVWAQDLATGRRRDLAHEEDRAFWTFAVVEVLRATGIRVEELTELSHHSLIQYRLPDTGEVIPLLQIAPSKTDAERLVVVSPELADVLSQIITRLRGPKGSIPLVAGYDQHERRWSAPLPLLFQRRVGTEPRAIPTHTIRTLLHAGIEHAGITDPATGQPLRSTPHDFRRLFITEALQGGLPPHIAQVIAGHRDINVTMGYKAVYPDEAIQAHLAFLARRRALRPTEEYRTPTDQEWQESSATSNAARSPSAPAAERSEQGASTNTPASAAHYCGPTRTNAPASSTSATTSSTASPKPPARAGSVRSKASR